MKRIIYGMSYDRRKILDDAYSYSEKIADHIMKCVVYGKQHKDYEHWIKDELCNKWFKDINDKTPKKHSGIKPDAYKKNLFAYMGDEVQDAKRDLMHFKRKYVEKAKNPYPDFEITQDLYFRVFDAYWKLADVISKKIGKYKESTAEQDIVSDIHSVLDKYC